MLAKETLVSDSSGLGPRYGSTRNQTRFQPQDEAPSVRANIGGRWGWRKRESDALPVQKSPLGAFCQDKIQKRARRERELFTAQMHGIPTADQWEGLNIEYSNMATFQL